MKKWPVGLLRPDLNKTWKSKYFFRARLESHRLDSIFLLSNDNSIRFLKPSDLLLGSGGLQAEIISENTKILREYPTVPPFADQVRVARDRFGTAVRRIVPDPKGGVDRGDARHASVLDRSLQHQNPHGTVRYATLLLSSSSFSCFWYSRCGVWALLKCWQWHRHSPPVYPIYLYWSPDGTRVSYLGSTGGTCPSIPASRAQ